MKTSGRIPRRGSKRLAVSCACVFRDERSRFAWRLLWIGRPTVFFVLTLSFLATSPRFVSPLQAQTPALLDGEKNPAGTVDEEDGSIPSAVDPIVPSPKIDLREQIARLSDPSYRVRQLAFWYLEADSENALPLFREYLTQLDIDAASRAIDLIADLALAEDSRVRSEATAILEQVGGKPTYVGRMATNTLEALLELQEEHAIEVLLHHGAKIGPRKFSLNGQIEAITEDALRITSSFTGDEETIRWISSIKSVKTVSLEGPQINRTYLEAVSRMRGVESIKLHEASVTAEDLLLLKRFRSLQHLGLLYLPIDDEATTILETLPVSSTMKVYGTKMSIPALEELPKRMPDIRFYCGRGGFLGVSPQSNTGTVIGNVTPGSAAQRAGMKINDEIRLIEGNRVRTFADLRTELGKYEAGRTVKVILLRFGEEMALDVKLQVER